MFELFHTILYEPMLNSLLFLYKEIPGIDLGIAIILLTIAIRIILFWPFMSSIRAQKSLQDIQPKLNEIKKKHANNKEEQSKQLMNFYKENKVNPFSSCLPLLIQLPILWALYRVFYNGLNGIDTTTGILSADQLQNLYGYLRDYFATNPIGIKFLGFVDLAATKNIYLAFLAGLAQFFQSRMMLAKKKPETMPKTKGARDEKMTSMMSKQMMYFMPLITVVFGYQFPAGLTLYWLTNTLIMIIQQAIFVRPKKEEDKKKKIIEGETIENKKDENKKEPSN